MTALPQIADHQCQCATCQASRALRSLRALPTLTDAGRAALDTIEMGIDALFEDSFAGWDAMNDVAVAAGLEWYTATRQDIIDAIKQARARAAELEAALTGDIQAVTADGQQHRIRRGNWRPYPVSLAAPDAKEPTP